MLKRTNISWHGISRHVEFLGVFNNNSNYLVFSTIRLESGEHFEYLVTVVTNGNKADLTKEIAEGLAFVEDSSQKFFVHFGVILLNCVQQEMTKRDHLRCAQNDAGIKVLLRL